MIRPRRNLLLLAALLALPLALAPRAEAFVYWTNEAAGTIGRANLDGTGVDQSFIAVGGPGGVRGVAVDAAHVYWANNGGGTIGRANLDGTGVDQSFIAVGGPGGVRGVAVDALRSFSFGNVKRKKEKGTAKLTVKVPGPGALNFTKAENVKGASTFAEVKGKARLPVRPRGRAKRRLNAKGKAKVTTEVTYTPQGGNPTIVGNTDAKTVKLVKRR